VGRPRTLPRDDFVALVEDVIGDRATVTNSSTDALAEISAPGVTKASGLATVAARHGIGPEDIVVFGDMPNDIAAFEWVRAAGGRAVAMAHAHADLMAVATDVTGTNEDDGVAAFLAAL
jgi:hydroxymethylpyrimidine pyrophosphatase-like HAD family hydrolase